MKLTIIGNSVALRIRPNKKNPLNKNYTLFLKEIFSKDNFEIENKAIGAQTVKDITNSLDNYINSFPDYFIINLGVVDSCSREVPLWFYRIATSKKDQVLLNLFSFVYQNIIARIRPILVFIRFKKPWISQKKFLKHYDLLIKTLIKETNANIICMGINLANDRIEKLLPGSRDRQKKYNKIISNLSQKYNQYFLDTADMKSNKYYPDGVHFNTEGHKQIAERIYKKIVYSKNL